jgi:putative phage-type endonuclease
MIQGSDEWHAARRGRVTASTVGAILGLSPYQTRADVLRAMVRASLGAEPEFTGNVATEHGNFHEEGARVEFEMETGLTVEKCGFFPHPEEDWLGASPDGLIGTDGLWECKSPYGLRNDPDPVFKPLWELPHYYAQCQIQMHCTGRTHCHFYQWTPHASRTEIVYISPGWLNENLPILRQFYAEYLDALKDPSEHLAPLRLVVDTPAAHKAIQEWDELKEQIELLEERKKDLLAELVEMGKGRDAIIAGRKLTKVEKAGSVSYAKVVKEKLPDLDLTPWTGKPSEYWKIT